MVGVGVLTVGDENLLELVETGTKSELVPKLKLSAGTIGEACKSISITEPA